jgi:hypothetical protein
MGTRPIAKKYCEGKVKRTLKRGSKALEIVIRKTYAAGNWEWWVQSIAQSCVCVASRKGVKHVHGEGGWFMPVRIVSTGVCSRLVAGDQGASGGSLSGDIQGRL